jgi:hypothetical protein
MRDTCHLRHSIAGDDSQAKLYILNTGDLKHFDSYSGAGGGIRTHEGLRHRISPASRILSQAPFDSANGPAPLT